MKTARRNPSNPCSIEPLLCQFLRDDTGQDLIEYALIFCLVVLGAVASMKSLVTAIAAVVTSVATTLSSAT
jgi:Flp pilus assembly pilin Flp